MLIVDGQIHLWEKVTASPPHRQGPYSAEQAIAAVDQAGDVLVEITSYSVLDAACDSLGYRANVAGNRLRQAVGRWQHL